MAVIKSPKSIHITIRYKHKQYHGGLFYGDLNMSHTAVYFSDNLYARHVIIEIVCIHYVRLCLARSD